MYKNVAGQVVAIYAHDTLTDTPETGDAANITADYSLDGGAAAPTNDVNPTELDAADLPGVYVFNMTQAETNGDLFVLVAQSTTAGVQIEPVIIYTTDFTGTAAAQIWAYATRTITQSAAQVAAAVAGSTITIPPYTTWTINLTGLGNLADRSKLYATFKESPRIDTDANALIQVEETVGLVIANKAPAPNPALASIVVTDAAAGNITITVDESVTGFPVRLGMGYDVKKITVGGDATLMTIGTFNISEIATRAIV